VADIERLKRSGRVTVNTIVNTLVDGAYDQLAPEELGGYSPEDLRRIIESYPDELVEPPPKFFEDLHVHSEPDQDPPAFQVALQMWTAREGRSRLVLRLRVRGVDWHPVIVDAVILSLAVEGVGQSAARWPRPD